MGVWSWDKESGSAELPWLESDTIDSGSAESEMTGSNGSNTWLETWVGLQVEWDMLGEEIIGSRNMASTGIATLGHIWGKEMDDCGDVTKEMKGKICSWNETSLEMNICFVAKFNNF